MGVQARWLGCGTPLSFPWARSLLLDMIAESGADKKNAPGLYQNSQTLTHAARRPTGIHCKNLRWSNGIYDIGAMPSADGAADESVSLRSLVLDGLPGASVRRMRW
jgi:hypothetical protein